MTTNNPPTTELPANTFFPLAIAAFLVTVAGGAEIDEGLDEEGVLVPAAAAAKSLGPDLDEELDVMVGEGCSRPVEEVVANGVCAAKEPAISPAAVEKPRLAHAFVEVDVLLPVSSVELDVVSVVSVKDDTVSGVSVVEDDVVSVSVEDVSVAVSVVEELSNPVGVGDVELADE